MSSGFLSPSHGTENGGLDTISSKGWSSQCCGADQRILPHDVEFVELDVVQEHIDAAEVVGGQVDLLPVEAPLDIVLAQHFFHLQQQRTGAAGRVIDLVDLRFADGAEAGQQL